MNSFLRFQINDILDCNANFTDIRVLHELLKNGLKVNRILNQEGSTPLHLAAGIFDEHISLLAVKALLSRSANPNYPDKEGKTSVHIAASLGHREVLQLLICNGGNILQSTLMGDTSIDLASRMEQYKVVSYLSLLLDTEEYELSGEPNFVSFLVNRQLLEFTEDLSSRHTSAKSYSMYTDVFSSKDSLYDDSFSYQNDFDESSYQWKSHTFSQQSENNFQKQLFNPFFLNATLDAYEDSNKTSLLDEGFTQPNMDYSQILFDTALDNSQLLSIDQCNESSTQTFFTPLSSLNRTYEEESFVTVIEDYVYKDKENGIELIERRFPGSLIFSRSPSLDESSIHPLNEFRSNLESSQLVQEESIDTLTSSIKNLSGKALRNKLKELGFDAFPVTPTTFRTLQRFYQRLRYKPKTQMNEEVNMIRRYSKELEKLCTIFQSDISLYQSLEDKMAKPFINPDPLSWWRNGIHKTCFNYLLLDPRITKNIALRPKFPISVDQFKTFLSAIFYIGKGSKTRPYSHLYEALKENSKYSEKKKLRKIKEIWEDDLGVVSLHVFQCTIPVEAWTREACMISAYGLHNLTNSVQGTFYGPASTFKKSDQRKLGSLCFFQAFHIYLYEGERQIRPKDLPSQPWKS